MREATRPYAALASVGEYAGTLQGRLPPTITWGDMAAVYQSVLA